MLLCYVILLQCNNFDMLIKTESVRPSACSKFVFLALCVFDFDTPALRPPPPILRSESAAATNALLAVSTNQLLLCRDITRLRTRNDATSLHADR